MANHEIDAAHLSITRSSAGVWAMRPIAGRSYKSPVQVTSNQVVYGGVNRFGDFAGIKGASHRFSCTVEIYNWYGMDGFDGKMQALVDAVWPLGKFVFRWPQMLGTEHTAQVSVATDAVVGDKEVVVSASTPLPWGTLVNFEANGKPHRVIYAPQGAQTANYVMGINPPLSKAVSAGTLVRSQNMESFAQFAAQPDLPTVDSIELQGVLAIREVP